MSTTFIARRAWFACYFFRQPYYRALHVRLGFIAVEIVFDREHAVGGWWRGAN